MYPLPYNGIPLRNCTIYHCKYTIAVASGIGSHWVSLVPVCNVNALTYLHEVANVCTNICCMLAHYTVRQPCS